MDAEYLNRCEKNGCVINNPNAKVWEDAFKADLHYMYEGSTPVVNKAFYEQIAAFLKNYRGE